MRQARRRRLFERWSISTNWLQWPSHYWACSGRPGTRLKHSGRSLFIISDATEIGLQLPVSRSPIGYGVQYIDSHVPMKVHSPPHMAGRFSRSSQTIEQKRRDWLCCPSNHSLTAEGLPIKASARGAQYCVSTLDLLQFSAVRSDRGFPHLLLCKSVRPAYRARVSSIAQWPRCALCPLTWKVERGRDALETPWRRPCILVRHAESLTYAQPTCLKAGVTSSDGCILHSRSAYPAGMRAAA
jgi:hypothetical protein